MESPFREQVLAYLRSKGCKIVTRDEYVAFVKVGKHQVSLLIADQVMRPGNPAIRREYYFETCYMADDGQEEIQRFPWFHTLEGAKESYDRVLQQWTMYDILKLEPYYELLIQDVET